MDKGKINKDKIVFYFIVFLIFDSNRLKRAGDLIFKAK